MEIMVVKIWSSLARPPLRSKKKDKIRIILKTSVALMWQLANQTLLSCAVPLSLLKIPKTNHADQSAGRGGTGRLLYLQ